MNHQETTDLYAAYATMSKGTCLHTGNPCPQLEAIRFTSDIGADARKMNGVTDHGLMTAGQGEACDRHVQEEGVTAKSTSRHMRG